MVILTGSLRLKAPCMKSQRPRFDVSGPVRCLSSQWTLCEVENIRILTSNTVRVLGDNVDQALLPRPGALQAPYSQQSSLQLSPLSLFTAPEASASSFSTDLLHAFSRTALRMQGRSSVFSPPAEAPRLMDPELRCKSHLGVGEPFRFGDMMMADTWEKV